MNRSTGFCETMVMVALLLPPLAFSQAPAPVNAGSAVGSPILSQNFPNPFNPSTTILYSIRETGMVTLKLYNILGVEVATLVNGRREAGDYTVRLNAGGNLSHITSGVYFYRLEAGSDRSTRKLVLLD